jgi:RpiR family transcriptional regulator, carbohydrate utilization regulator
MNKKKNFLQNAGSIAIISSIRRTINKMPPTQKKIAKYIIKNPRKVIMISISQLAMESGAKSESSVVKFYRNLGFSGYHDFKVSLATEIAGKSFYYSYEDITEKDDINAIKRKIFQGAIKTLDENQAVLSVDLLENVVLEIEKANRLIFLGFATSASVAMSACFRFLRLGIDCYFSQDPHINAIRLTEPKDGDVIFAISNSGESKDVVKPIEQAKPIAKVIALTGVADSPLDKLADVSIVTVSEEMNYRTDALITRLVQMAVIETLFTTMAVRIGPRALDRLSKTRKSLSYLKY